MERPYSAKRRTSVVSPVNHCRKLGDSTESERDARVRRRKENLLPDLNATAAILQPVTPSKLDVIAPCLESPSSIVSLKRQEKDASELLLCEGSLRTTADLDSITSGRTRTKAQRKKANRKVELVSVTAEEELSVLSAAKLVPATIAVPNEAIRASDGIAASALLVPNPEGVESIGCADKSRAAGIAAALEHLSSVDPILAEVIARGPPPTMWKMPRSMFRALAKSIVFQQLHGNAATAIHGRLVALCEGSSGLGEESVTPDALLALDIEDMRKAGLSYRKAGYLHDLADHFQKGKITEELISKLDDEQLTTALTAVRGIGEWSVHMFMMFSLSRPDVLPVGDLAVRKGFQKLYKLKGLPTPKEMSLLADKWRPYRSFGSYYMWQLMDVNVPATTAITE